MNSLLTWLQRNEGELLPWFAVAAVILISLLFLRVWLIRRKEKEDNPSDSVRSHPKKNKKSGRLKRRWQNSRTQVAVGICLRIPLLLFAPSLLTETDLNAFGKPGEIVNRGTNGLSDPVKKGVEAIDRLIESAGTLDPKFERRRGPAIRSLNQVRNSLLSGDSAYLRGKYGTVKAQLEELEDDLNWDKKHGAPRQKLESILINGKD